METRGLSRVLVIYDSQSGFTEKMAKFVIKGAEKVKGVEVELLKVGAPFSLFKIEKADAIIFGSPNNYSNVTSEMNTVLESLKNLDKVSGKIGGVFGSYTWNRGEVVEKLNMYIAAFGMRVVAPPVSIAYRDYEEIHIDKEYLQKCIDLGRIVAEQAVATSPITPP